MSLPALQSSGALILPAAAELRISATACSCRAEQLCSSLQLQNWAALFLSAAAELSSSAPPCSCRAELLCSSLQLQSWAALLLPAAAEPSSSAPPCLLLKQITGILWHRRLSQLMSALAPCLYILFGGPYHQLILQQRVINWCHFIKVIIELSMHQRHKPWSDLFS